MLGSNSIIYLFNLHDIWLLLCNLISLIIAWHGPVELLNLQLPWLHCVYRCSAQLDYGLCSV